jgi:nucleotide-binding universal stress UspA family protein
MPGLSAMIPLDGSKFAESAFDVLPLLKDLGFEKVRLVSVWENDWEELATGRETELAEAGEKGRSFLEAYLREQSARVTSAGLGVETVIKAGRAHDEIVEASKDVDLVVIATHGRSGLTRMRLGSVADSLVQDAPCPTLVIGPNVVVDLETYKMDRILLPLDGSAEGEEALPVAAWIADKTSASLDLLRVISLSTIAIDPSMGFYPGDLITAIEEGAKEYLQKVAAGLGEKRKVRASIMTGSAGDQIIEYLEKEPAALVIMGSHARGGIMRAALGSITDHVLRGPAPVLVLRTDEEKTSKFLAAAHANA